MKKALILSYYFPPANAVPAFRTLSWAKHLKENGIFPVILTRHWTGNEISWTDLTTDSNEKITHEIFPDYEVFRLPSAKFSWLKLFEGSLLKINFFRNTIHFLLHYFGRLNYISNADDAFRPFLKKHLLLVNYDIIIATSPPLNIIRLADFLNIKFKIPFIVDFRDLWNNDILKDNYQVKGLSKLLEKRTEYWLKKWLKNASLCTAVSEPIADKLGIVFKFERDVVLNGYDEEIFNSLEREPQNFFNITLSGTYYEKQGLEILIEGLNGFLKNKNPDEVKVVLVGLSSNAPVENLFINAIPSTFLIRYNRLKMKDAMQKVKNAHVLLHSAWKGLKGVYTTKIFDFIASGNNILLAPGDNDVMDQLILETKTGCIANNVSDVITQLDKWFAEWKISKDISYKGSNAILNYSRISQVKKMAASIHNILNRNHSNNIINNEVLVISYYFPPCTGAPSWRPFSWAENFNNSGLKPTILTRHWLGTENKWSDYLKENLLPATFRRNSNFELFALPTKRPKIYSWLENSKVLRAIISKPVFAYFIFSGRFNTEIDAYLTFKDFLTQLLNRNNYAAVIITTPPPNILELTRLVKENSNALVIVDFRDLWNNKMLKIDYSVGLKQKIFDKMHAIYHVKWLKSADVITGIVPEFQDILKNVSDKKMQVYYNGFEKNLFDEVKKEKNLKFRFSVVGSIYPDQDLSILLDGLIEFLKDKNIDDVVIRFIGLSSIPEVEQKIRESLPKEFVEITGRVPKEVAISYTKNAEVLFYPGWKGSKGIISTKAFDYIASGNIILIAPGDDSTLDQLINSTETGFIANTKEEFVNYMKSCFDEWKTKGELGVHGNAERIDFFSRQNQAVLFAESIKSTLGINNEKIE